MMLPMSALDQAREFLKIAPQFQLGELTTERSHPLSRDLSQLARENLPAALNCLKRIDVEALETLSPKADGIARLGSAIRETLQSGGRLYLGGCGATGRLSLAVEVLCREELLPREYQDRVIGFMAGGDAALIRSIENFEDLPEYGARQLRELGFGENDLFIGSTEGGETPFVIGATEAAAQHSQRSPWFLYCNPDDELKSRVERSRRVLENQEINKLNLTVGPMALAGSTRMQASTVLMLAILIAIDSGGDLSLVERKLTGFTEYVRTLDYTIMAPLTEAESAIYQQGNKVLYATHDYGITVLTDTTERAPTFSLPSFENTQDPRHPPCLCYLSLPQSPDSLSAWQHLLRRLPRTLEWEGICGFTGIDYFLGFDISARAHTHRTQRCGLARHHLFQIDQENGDLVLTLQEHRQQLPTGDRPSYIRHLLLKLLLNAHSTLIMGRLGRYEGNLMTYVRASNNKLIDRAARYVRELYHRKTGKILPYEQAIEAIFAAKDNLGPDEPIVLTALHSLTDHG